MRIYISGKISGLPIDQARELFQKAEEDLTQRYAEYEVELVNPFKIDHSLAISMERSPENHSIHDIWVQYMKEDLAALMNCDCIYMLTNWVHSKGARCEYAIAKELGLTVEYEQ